MVAPVVSLRGTIPGVILERVEGFTDQGALAIVTVPSPGKDDDLVLRWQGPEPWPAVDLSVSCIQKIYRDDVGDQRGLRLRFHDGSPLMTLRFRVFSAILCEHLVEYLQQIQRMRAHEKRPGVFVVETLGARGRDEHAMKRLRAHDPRWTRETVMYQPHQLVLEGLGFRPQVLPAPLTVEELAGARPDGVALRGLSPPARAQFWAQRCGCWPVTAEQVRHVGVLRRRVEGITIGQLEIVGEFAEVLRVIESDVLRHDRRAPEFRDPSSAHARLLQNVLVLYALYNRDLAYVQGMSDLCGLLLLTLVPRFEGDSAVFADGSLHTLEEAEAAVFWTFAGFMQVTQYDRLYLDLAAHEHVVLRPVMAVIKAVYPQLFQILDGSRLLDSRLLFGSLVLLFRRDFSREGASRIIDAVLAYDHPLAFVRLFTIAALIVAFPNLDRAEGELASSMMAMEELLERTSAANVISLAMELPRRLEANLRRSLRADLPTGSLAMLGYKCKFFPLK